MSNGEALPPEAMAIIAALPADGHTRGNISLRDQLGVPPDRYADAATVLKDLGLVVAGRGRGGSLALTLAGQQLRARLDGKSTGEPAQATSAGIPEAAVPNAEGPDRNDAEWQPTSAPASRTDLTQQELESRLWAAANSLRGPVDAADFKAYIFPLLFFKRICDAWDEEHEQAASDYDDLLDDEIEADYHRFAVPEACHWDDLRRLTDNVGVGLQRMLQRIEQANPETLAGVFGDVQWGNKEKLPETALVNLIDAFDSLDLSPSRVGNDVLGVAYEYLLKQFADSSGAKAGEFFTPRAVVRLLTRILDPQPTDSVYDPACGSGGMLVEAANEVLEAGGSLRQMRFYAQEVNLTTAAIARMDLYLHEIEDARVLRGDTLRDPKFRDAKGRLDRFDVVIANPPFSFSVFRLPQTRSADADGVGKAQRRN
ncbi:MAG: class I SAM-dependent DNA methyltransferase [Actinomycetota bacterium]|nr:class I SAM-dependent DNA methyltransferase [Actinomycetota bacterium]